MADRARTPLAPPGRVPGMCAQSLWREKKCATRYIQRRFAWPSCVALRPSRGAGWSRAPRQHSSLRSAGPGLGRERVSAQAHFRYLDVNSHRNCVRRT
jgi:hypothetical protein